MAVDPSKDVDGFHPNFGKMALDMIIPATPFEF
jgi:methylenetetrahydrofolate dehydrogenase (NADP+)/methenyltetrahydrofolate cyclohydrolase